MTRPCSKHAPLLIAALLAVASLTNLAQAQSPNDPLYPQQTYLQSVGVPNAWAVTTGSSGVKIAVIGEGQVESNSFSHEDLGSKTTVYMQNTYGGEIPIPNTSIGAAGIAAAITNNGKGIAGVNWASPIYAYEMGQARTETIGGESYPVYLPSVTSATSAINNAVSRGSQILLTTFIVRPASFSGTLTFSTQPRTQLLGGVGGFFFDNARNILNIIKDTEGQNWNNALAAVRSAYLADRTIIAPMGDFDGVVVGIPAGLASQRLTIGVGSTETNVTRAYRYSASSGPGSSVIKTNIDLVAPGVNMLTTKNAATNDYGNVTSTAASAGLVAGVASLMKSKNSSLKPDDIREILRRTAVDIGSTGYDTKTGFGRLNADAALRYVQQRIFTRGVATGGTATKIRSGSVTLINGAWGTLASGTYYGVDVYRVRFTVNLTGADPHIWWRGDETAGWSGANPNDESIFARLVSVSGGVATLETFVYNIKYDVSGRLLANQWYPTTRQNAKVAYTISTVGAPPPPPPAPTGVRISNTSSIGAHPILVWNASSGATGYKVYRCYSTSAACTNYTYIGPTTATSYEDFDYLISSSCGGGLFYQVRATNSAGSSPPAGTDGNCGEPSNSAAEGALTAQAGALEAVPTAYALEAAYPNPFNPTTEIRFALPEAADVRLTVYDALGREVARLVDGPVGAGHQHATFDAGGLPSGLYLYRLEAKGAAEAFAKTGRMVLVK